ncbi:hypothetical protein PQQ88_31855 [Paraburkholderia caledonica]|uniref:hypothetical protein n=1 Tax=Paraburkholderia caledonica TaxID=134536 RepID=UPI0038BC713E
MQTHDELGIEFIENIERIAEILVDGFGLKHSRKVDRTLSSLLRWTDFRLRFIAPSPRKIFVSDKFPLTLDAETEGALHLIENKITSGEDVNPFQGKGLMLLHDTSGKSRGARTDLLWADWGIHHLHLCSAPVDKARYFSERAPFVLFAIFGTDHALFVDVRSHKEDFLFAREELISTVARSWPAYVEAFELKGTLPPKASYSDEERDQLRKAGIEPMLMLEGKAYFAPGQGITSAATSGRVTAEMFRVRKNLSWLVGLVLDPDGQFLGSLPTAAREQSRFSLSLVVGEGIVLIEQHTGRGWSLAGAETSGVGGVFAELSNALAPSWVRDAIAVADNRGDGSQIPLGSSDISGIGDASN